MLLVVVAVVQALVAAAAAVASVDLQGGVHRPGEPQPVSVEAPSEPSLSTAAYTDDRQYSRNTTPSHTIGIVVGQLGTKTGCYVRAIVTRHELSTRSRGTAS